MIKYGPQFQQMKVPAMQTECVEKIDKNIEADLKPEVAEKDGESPLLASGLQK